MHKMQEQLPMQRRQEDEWVSLVMRLVLSVSVGEQADTGVFEKLGEEGGRRATRPNYRPRVFVSKPDVKFVRMRKTLRMSIKELTEEGAAGTLDFRDEYQRQMDGNQMLLDGLVDDLQFVLWESIEKFNLSLLSEVRFSERGVIP
jgi:hypothetical protein